MRVRDIRAFFVTNRSFLAAALLPLSLVFSAASHAELQEMSDASLSDVSGQALFVADKISPNSLVGAGGTGSTTDFTYYRIGLDIKMAMNLNIDKLKLGCGGINDSLVAGCDIDLDYVRFLGRTNGGGQTSPDGYVQAGSGAAVTSDFVLTRPYLEIAVKNDANKTQREIVGIKIGAQTADGYLSVGSYDSSTGTHTGINMVSAYLNAYLSGWVQVSTSLGGGTACIGKPSYHESQCGTKQVSTDIAADIVANTYNINPNRTTGTRMTRLQVPGAPLHDLKGTSGLISLLNGATLNANLDLDMNMLHGLGMYGTNDFFISMERQPVRYPKYDKTGYAYQANTGFWMNVPMAAVTDVFPPSLDLGCPGGFLCLGMLSAFGYPGLGYSNPDLGSRPISNCYGASLFC